MPPGSARRGGPRVLSQILPETGPSDLDLALLGAGDRLERSERQGTLQQGLRPDQVRSHEVSAKAGQLQPAQLGRDVGCLVPDQLGQ